METVHVLAPAKINLWLRVLAREASGYHSLETLFAAVSLADRLEIMRSPTAGVTLEVSGEDDIGPIEKNLVYRAASAFLSTAFYGEGVFIRLEKVIPSAAGLGGGSSDAAATLRGLSALFAGAVSGEELLRIASRLGSDVPFFLAETPLALGWGRGERLLALEPLPKRSILIAHPGVAMPTGDAFRRLAELRGAATEPVPQALHRRDVGSWPAIARFAQNDFETPAFERIPRLAAAKTRLREGGADIALLAGSGASIFGIFESSSLLEPVAAELERQGWRCWREQTIEAWPMPVPGIDFPSQVR